MTSERTLTNSKGKLPGHNKKEIHEIKKTIQDMKEEFNKDMEKSQKKESNRNPGNKRSLKSN
jgi:hypothetical protein